MPIYNVEVTKRMLVVVVAEDESDARSVAFHTCSQAFSDADPDESFDVRGEVRSSADLREGWDEECIPYGHDGNTTLGLLFSKGEWR